MPTILLQPIPYTLQQTGNVKGKMAAVAGVSLSVSTPRVLANASDSPIKSLWLNHPWKMMMSTQFGTGRMYVRVRPVAAAPEGLSEKVAESIKAATETCSDDPASGECVAAWDEVEELSAAASHKRVKSKDFDPLETYCKDNPETDECRTYED